MDDNGFVARNIALQREWYGEPLGDRVRRLVVTFDMSQASLAGVLGLSPPMLSQVMSGRRAKIGNPAVFARLIMLERLAARPAVAAGDREAVRQALEEVRESKPSATNEALTTEALRGGVGEEAAFVVLRAIAGSADLAAAAATLEGQHRGLAQLLRRAAQATIE